MIIYIIIIIITFIITYIYMKNNTSCIIKKYIKNIENERNIAMNGLDISYYINFSFHYKLFNLFELVSKKLDEKGINYFIICGGLIGYFRHNQGFIPWDDDIDIGVMEEDRSKLHDAINELKKDYKYINLGVHDLDKVLYGDFNENPIQIDIFYFKYFPDKNYYFYIVEKHRKMWKNEYFYKDELFPLQKVPFKLYAPDGTIYKEIKVNIPNKSKDYLDRAYKNWNSNMKPTHIHSDYYNLIFPFTRYIDIVFN